MCAYQMNSFSRTRANEAKMGAYYTDISHAADIGKLFIWPENEEVCILEPSIGDGSAVVACTDAVSHPERKIFGVELNDRVAKQTAENPCIFKILRDDFTNGVMIRKGAFSFCFANPPYLNDRDEEESEVNRLEKVFLDKISNYLKIGGILVWIVNTRQFYDKSHLRSWIRDYETLAVYKFRPEEYEKYKQIVVVGRLAKKGADMDKINQFMETYAFDKLSELPHNPEAFIPVLPSSSAGVDLFATRIFRADDAYAYLQGQGIPKDILSGIDRRVSTKPFSEGDLKRPPIPLKNDSLFLLVASGVGQGFTGSEETCDLHLQRGVAEVVDEVRYHTNDEEEHDDVTGTCTVTSKTNITMTVLENDGTTRVLM